MLFQLRGELMKTFLLFAVSALCSVTFAVQVGATAPDFQLKTHEGKNFSLSSRKNAGWTVIFFYPKAGTPGCTKQACAFRDSVKKIQALGAEVFGISSDTVEEQAKFHKEHRLLYPLLADPKMEAIQKFGAKMDDRDLAKRWTFIIDPNLVIRAIDEKVDPIMDPDHVIEQLKKLQKKA
jgi:thioredoxin-dependent peroxiredoxin